VLNPVAAKPLLVKPQPQDRTQITAFPKGIEPARSPGCNTLLQMKIIINSILLTLMRGVNEATEGNCFLILIFINHTMSKCFEITVFRQAVCVCEPQAANQQACR